MSLTTRIELACGHSTAITRQDLANEAFSCPTCSKVSKISKEERLRIAEKSGWDTRKLRIVRSKVI